jgi:hypothetical protein
MVVLGYEDRNSLDRARALRQPKPVAHPEALTDLGNCSFERTEVGHQVRGVEHNALEELTCAPVGVLVRIQDVCTMPSQKLSQGCDDAPSIRTGNQKGRKLRGCGLGFGHGPRTYQKISEEEARTRQCQAAGRPRSTLSPHSPRVLRGARRRERRRLGRSKPPVASSPWPQSPGL